MTSAAPPVTLSPEHRQRLTRWVEALESGRYRQGKGQLGRITDFSGFSEGDLLNSVEYCCLGVLCEVAIAEGLPLMRRQSGHAGGDLVYVPGDVWEFPTLGMISLLHGVVLDFFGLAPPLGDECESDVVIGQGTSGALTASRANDLYDYSFAEIALKVRQYYGLGEPS